jgi:hypothetical protein
MRLQAGACSIMAVSSLAVLIWHAQAQTAARNLSGNYRCEPQPVSCQWGQTFSVTQSGNTLQLKSDKGEQGNARLTSDSTISSQARAKVMAVDVRDARGGPASVSAQRILGRYCLVSPTRPIRGETVPERQQPDSAFSS